MTSETNSDVKPAAFCRICGKGLTEAEMREAQGIIYCAEHAPAPPPPRSAASPWTGPVPPDTGASPGLAFILGLIPGVGAIYNGQYAKGLIHVVIFGLLVSIVSSGSAGGLDALFGMLIGVWIFYMAFEAYHSARKRQAGQPVDEFSSLVPLKGSGAGTKVAPAVLIAIGVLFLLLNFDVIRLYQIMRFWPAILIAIGVYMLYVRKGGGSARTGEEIGHER